MGDHQPTSEQLHQAALILGDPVALAKEEINQYAQQLNTNFGTFLSGDTLIEVGKTWVDSNKPWGGEFINLGPVNTNMPLRKSFWESLGKYLEQVIPQEKQKNFFLAQEPERRTGRSTRLVIQFIGQLLEHPGKRFKIVDHHPRHDAALLVFNEIRTVLDVLQIEYTASNDLTIVVHPLPAHRIRI